MATEPEYPLIQVMMIKKNRFDQAVKVLEEKKELLEKEYEKLYDVTQIFNSAQEHRVEKLDQFRDELDRGTTTDKIQQMKTYLKVAEEDAFEKRKKVDAQQKQVDAAQDQVDEATEDLFQKKKDLEKLEMHKKEWTQEMQYELERKEGLEQDEQGSTSYNRLKREKKKRGL